MNLEYKRVIEDRTTMLNSKELYSLLFLCREQEDLELLREYNEYEQKFRKCKSSCNRGIKKTI